MTHVRDLRNRVCLCHPELLQKKIYGDTTAQRHGQRGEAEGITGVMGVIPADRLATSVFCVNLTAHGSQTCFEVRGSQKLQFCMCDSAGRHSEDKESRWVRHEKAEKLQGTQKGELKWSFRPQI